MLTAAIIAAPMFILPSYQPIPPNTQTIGITLIANAINDQVHRRVANTSKPKITAAATNAHRHWSRKMLSTNWVTNR